MKDRRSASRSLYSMAAILVLGAASFPISAQTAPQVTAAPAPATTSPSLAEAPPAPTSAVPPETVETQAPAHSGETITAPGSTSPRNWTTDQILTATVHQAWILAGKDEANFFEIVRQLAEISAENRNLTLPDNPEAGKKAGAYIKGQAKQDHDQLLYDIVDKAVRMTGVKSPSGPGTDSNAPHPGE